MPLYDYRCEKCGEEVVDRVAKAADEVACPVCATVMVRLDSLPAAPVFGAGRSAESRAEWGVRERARLESRSTAYDQSAQGKQEREATVDRLRKTGTIPDGWSA